LKKEFGDFLKQGHGAKETSTAKILAHNKEAMFLGRTSESTQKWYLPGR
jgi:hypothetical protein